MKTYFTIDVLLSGLKAVILVAGLYHLVESRRQIKRLAKIVEDLDKS